jgi:hypothetical protein
MKKIIAFCLVGIISTQSFIGCSKSSGAIAGTGGSGSGGGRTFTCAGITPTFAADVQPILTTVCSINSNCHAGGSTNSGGPFTNYTEVNTRKSNIRAAILSGAMPQTGSITQAQVNAFICWIDSGAPNN